jgi:hypothetical protein
MLRKKWTRIFTVALCNWNYDKKAKDCLDVVLFLTKTELKIINSTGLQSMLFNRSRKVGRTILVEPDWEP